MIEIIKRNRPNFIIMFKDETSKIQGIYIDTTLFKKLYIPDEDCKLLSQSGKELFLIINGSEYKITVDQVHYVEIDSHRKQMSEKVKNYI
jgi:hypothetical protein